jgi:secreted trypsin-like serine protease
VSGWGYTRETSHLSNVLRQLRVPSIPNKKCKKDVPEDYRRYITHDKLCAGYLKNGSSVCNGDSGGGLVFKFSNRFFIAGVVSLSPLANTAGGGCNSHQYGVYTVVYNYDHFILRNMVRFKPAIGDDSMCESCTTVTPPPTTIEETGSTADPTKPTEPTKSTERPQDGCILPEHPNSGRWSVLGNSAPEFSPGKFVAKHTILVVQCNEKHKLDGLEYLVCRSGSWSAKVGKCLKTCSSLQNTLTTKVVCLFNTKETDHCTDPVDGTLAKFTCAPFYEEKGINLAPLLCVDGTWSRPPPKCVPVCGQKSIPSTALIVKGDTTNKGEFPWQVAIYQRRGLEPNQLICGGTLISERIILTAAHCVTDYEGKVLSKSNYTLAVGKYYRSYSDPRDTPQAQFSEVDDIFVPVQYKGMVQNYFEDIAIMVSKRIFQFSQTVQPVCVDWTKTYLDDFLKSDTKGLGHISGWGFTEENQKPSDELRSIRLPLISRQNCLSQLGEDFEIYLTFDKLCAGYQNGTSVCKGDAGGGLVFKHANNRFYIFGILSLAPSSDMGGCDTHQYALYTDVKYYVDSFLLGKVARYNIL